MAFRAKGFLPGNLPYSVVVADDGETVGSMAVRRLLAEQQPGATVKVTPTGPFVPFKPGDPHSVLAVLMARTSVTGVSGDVPTIDLGASTGRDRQNRTY